MEIAICIYTKIRDSVFDQCVNVFSRRIRGGERMSFVEFPSNMAIFEKVSNK